MATKKIHYDGPALPYVYGLCMLMALGLLAVTLGCRPKEYIREDRATLSGTVTYDNAPLPAGVMSLISKENRQIRHNTMIEDGRYSTPSAPLGELIITIETVSIQFGNAAAYVPIPDRYRDPDKSGLTAEVKPGKNEANFVLTK
ncbi:MAG: hypothetical protein JW829_21360 [Pirellulales bacterium]|nr:hypothetical protein [Pirellulales bacterium]